MESLVVRGLDEAVTKELARRARENGRSMEAEVRSILTDVVAARNVGVALYEASRTAPVELPAVHRKDEARSVAFE